MSFKEFNNKEFNNSDFQKVLREFKAQEENEPWELEYERALREVQARKELRELENTRDGKEYTCEIFGHDYKQISVNYKLCKRCCVC